MVVVCSSPPEVLVQKMNVVLVTKTSVKHLYGPKNSSQRPLLFQSTMFATLRLTRSSYEEKRPLPFRQPDKPICERELTPRFQALLRSPFENRRPFPRVYLQDHNPLETMPY